MKKIAYIFFFLFIGSKLFAQGSNTLQFNHLDAIRGLVDPKVNTIFEDSGGLLWIGTQNGLFQFDGNKCVTFRNIPGDDNSLCNNNITNIIEDKYGNLYIGTGNGLSKYIRNTNNFTTFRHFRGNTKIKSNYYSYPFFIDINSDIWLYMQNYVCKVNLNTLEMTAVDSTAYNRIFTNQVFYTELKRYTSIYESEGLFYTELKNGVPVYTKAMFNEFTVSKVEPHLRFTSLYIENDTTYWLACGSELLKLNPINSKFNLISKLKDIEIDPLSVSPYPNKKNLLLIGTKSKGLLIFNKKDNELTNQYLYNIYDPSSLASNCIENILVDVNNNIFLQVTGVGLDFTNTERQQFQSYYPLQNSPLSKYVNNVVFIESAAQDRYIITGVKDAGISFYDNEKNDFSQFVNLNCFPKKLLKINEFEFLSLCENHTFQRVMLVKNVWKLEKLKIKSAAKDFFINDLILLKNGKILAATQIGIHYLELQGNTITPIYISEINQTLENINVTKIIQAPNSEFYFHNQFTSLSKYKFQNDRFRPLGLLEYTPFRIIDTKIFNEMMWLATSNGIWTVDLKKRHSLKQIALIDSYCTGIIMDKSFLFWISTQNGLFKLYPVSLKHQEFSIADGLQHFTFNENAILQTKNGDIYVGGIKGYNKFNPAKIMVVDEDYPIFISKILINDKIFFGNPNSRLPVSINLKHNENSILFSLSPMSYSGNPSLPIFYKLEGYDQDFIKVNGYSQIRYPNLPPGNYRFVTYGYNKSKQKEIMINIKKPYWLTTSFIIFFSIIILGLIASAIKYRVVYIKNAQLRKIQIMLQSQEEERMRIARDLHDDFGARLSALKLYIAIGAKNQSKQAEITTNITSMLDTSISELRNILFSLSPKSLNEVGLKATLEEFVSNVEIMTNLKVNLDLDYLKPNLKSAVEFSLYRVCQELLNNTIKHSGSQEAFLSIVSHTSELVLLYEDNGKGFDTHAVKRGYGLNNIELHVQSLNGSLSILSEPWKGIAISINLPI